MRTTLLILLFLALLSGCQSPSSDPAFADVQHLTADRAGVQIRWNRSSADDRAVASAVDDLLSHELTADQAVEIALLNNHSLQAIYAQLGIAQADLVQAGLLANPVFDASIRFPDKSPKGPDVELSISQEFIDLLFIPARKKLAAAQFEQAKLEIAQAVVDRAADARSAYYTLVAAQQMLELRKTAADAMHLAAQTAKQMHDAGNLNDLGLANQLAADEEAKANVELADADLQDARENLAGLMGLSDAQAHFTVAPRLPEAQADPSTGDFQNWALSQRLDVAAAKESLEAAARSNDLVQSQRFFTGLAIGADTERNPDGQRVTGPIISWPIPLFDQGQASAMRAAAELSQAREQYEALKVRVRSDVRRAAAKMISLHARAQRFRAVIIPLRQQIVEQSQLHYNGMLLDVLQLLQAKQSEIESASDYIAALRDYWLARTELERVVGGRLPDAPQKSDGVTG